MAMGGLFIFIVCGGIIKPYIRQLNNEIVLIPPFTTFQRDCYLLPDENGRLILLSSMGQLCVVYATAAGHEICYTFRLEKVSRWRVISPIFD